MKIKKWNKYLKDNINLQEAVVVLSKIEKAGYKAYIVGGAPRDMVLEKLELIDIDIATNCPIDKLDKMFTTHDIGRSRDFGIVVVKLEHCYFETAQFRKDKEYKDGRHPESVQIVDDLETDIKRRDFTVNALALTERGEIINYVDSVNDIKNKVIRTVGDPYKRFEEDYVRMIRAARFGSIEGFKITDKTQQAIKKMASLINNTTPERIRLELIKAADKPGKMFAKFIVLLEDLGLLKHILPEISDLKNYPHTLDFHPEGLLVWDHIIRCVEISDKDYLSQLAILFHDIGKAKTLTFKKNGKPKYYFHASVGAEMVAGICDRLKFSTFQKEALVYATKNHMKWHKILEMKPSKIARMIDSPYFGTLMDVCEADEFSRGEKFVYKGYFDKQLEHALDIKRKWELQQLERPIRLVDGKRIMELTGLKPSKLVGKIKEEVEDYIIDNDIDFEDQGKVDKLIKNAFIKNTFERMEERIKNGTN